MQLELEKGSDLVDSENQSINNRSKEPLESIKLGKSVTTLASIYGKKTTSIKSFTEKIVRSIFFKILILTSILVNVIILLLENNLRSEKFLCLLEKINFGLTIFFVFEILLKIMSYEIRNYFNQRFGFIDFLIIFLNLIEIIYEKILGENIFSPRNKSSSIIKPLKILRIFLFFYEIKILENAGLLFIIFINTFRRIFGWIIIIFLFIIASSIVGMEMFAYRIRFVDEYKKPIYFPG